MAKTVSGIITFLIFSGVLYSFVYIPNADVINEKFNIDFKMPELFSKSESKKRNTKTSTKARTSDNTKVATVLDNYKGVKIYHNGSVRNVHGRNTTSDGYNLGLRYQCVEFVKRFYYEVYGHKMPNSYGHAKEFFNPALRDGGYNKDRAMTQYSNASTNRPKRDDLIVFGAAPFNKFGHVAIVSDVGPDYVEIAQQNPGVGNPSKAKYQLIESQGRYVVVNDYVKGWLRL